MIAKAISLILTIEYCTMYVGSSKMSSNLCIVSDIQESCLNLPKLAICCNPISAMRPYVNLCCLDERFFSTVEDVKSAIKKVQIAAGQEAVIYLINYPTQTHRDMDTHMHMHAT